MKCITVEFILWKGAVSMGYTIAQKIIKNHLVDGQMKVAQKSAFRIDQTLTQDATGTMAYLEF